jgi:hypothetical protein
VDDWPVELAMVSTGKLLGVALGYCHFMPFVCSQGRTLYHQQWRVFICLSGCFQHNKTVFFMGGKLESEKPGFQQFQILRFFLAKKSSCFTAKKSPRSLFLGGFDQPSSGAKSGMEQL